ncbi:TPM domain-containing protein [Methylophilus sp. 5]|uniref:TPM domain-containing protein n=1 Tax=Methylophilus sp. 5 TaxID=1112274 RepID=UPI00048B8989|nr:TPM domain-containing protein [Methylophilus sp. 5]
MKPVHPFNRWFKHAWSHPRHVKALFSPQALKQIEQTIAQNERHHAGEIRVVIEAGLPTYAILRGVTPRQRAINLFGHFNIWDTEHNNGVLIYLLLADHDVEIVADRGIHRQVGDAGWQLICQQMEGMFRSGQFESGVVYGIQAIGEQLARSFPPEAVPRNELPNRVLII